MTITQAKATSTAVPGQLLLAFFDQHGTSITNDKTLPLQSIEYLELIDLTGRVVAKGKLGRIDKQLAPILERLGLSTNEWVSASTQFKQHYRRGRLSINATA